MGPNTFNEAKMIKVIFVNINTPPPTSIVLRNRDDSQGWSFAFEMVCPEFIGDVLTNNKSFALLLSVVASLTGLILSISDSNPENIDLNLSFTIFPFFVKGEF